MAESKPSNNLYLNKKKKKTKLSIPAFIVACSLILIVFSTLLSGLLSTSNNPCTGPGCHGSSKWEYTNLLSGDPLSDLPTIFKVGISKNVTIAIEVTGAESIKEYKIQTLKVTLSSLNSKVSIKNAQQQVTNKWPGDKVTFEWEITGTSSGTDTLIFDLWAYNDHDGNISWAATFTDQYQYDIIVQGKPYSPQDLNAVAGDGYILLTWKAPSFDGGVGITKYNIYKGTDTGSETFESFVGESIREYNDTSVSNGQEYYYYVTAENSIGESSPSIEVSAIPRSSNTVPNSPNSIQALPGKDYVDLTWEVPSYDGGSTITGFKLYRGTDSGSQGFYTSINQEKTSYRDSVVISGTTYYYYITALNEIGESTPSLEVFGTPDNEPPSISIISPPDKSFINSNSLYIEWTGSDEISGINHYEVKLNSGNWIDVGNGSSYTFLSLTEGLHEISIKAVDKLDNSNQAKISVTVDLQAPILVITSPLNGSVLNTSTLNIEWECDDKTSGIDHYDLRLDNGLWIDVGSVKIYSLKSLDDGEHIVQIKATDNTQNIIIAQVIFTIDATKPTILLYNPTGVNEPLDTAIFIAFSEEMDKTSILISIDGISGTIAWVENNITFTPNFNLAYDTEYKVEVSGSDLNGNKIEKFTWSFNTQEQEKIKGQILDDNDKPIINASILLDSKIVGTTNSNGFFTLELSPGDYSLTITKQGYKTKVVDVKLGVGKVKNLGKVNLELQEAPPEEPEPKPKDEESTEFPWIMVILVIVIIVIIIIGLVVNKIRSGK